MKARILFSMVSGSARCRSWSAVPRCRRHGGHTPHEEKAPASKL